jgi:PAS domain S-box-containing protein
MSSMDPSDAADPGAEPFLDVEFFRSLVENGSDAIVTIDEDSTVVYANRSVERVFGYQPDELVGEPLTTIMPERFQTAHHESLAAYLATGEKRLDWTDIQLPAERADGTEVTLDITFEEHLYEGDRVFSGIMRDISDRVEREEALERQNEQLERFASIVSHDIRDPLQSAQATTTLMRARTDGEVDDLVDDLDAALDRMDALVGDVLDLAKHGKRLGDTVPVDLGGVARDAWEVVETGEAALDVGDLPEADGDPDRLGALFTNLFGNAVEHGDASLVRVGPLDAGGFYVEDDGVGLGDVDRDRLFEYGYTESESGTGFGLNIVESVADVHGWDVVATDGETSGARFEFREVGR